MKKTTLLALTFVVIFSFSIVAQEDDVSESEININRNVTLLVEEKEPAVAYSMSLLPIFGPNMSANYVSQSPLEWEIDEDLERRATMQTIYNLGAVFGGFTVDAMMETPGLFTTIGYLAAIVHNHFFGNDMAQTAVNYNKDLHEEFDWSHPQISIDF